MVGNLILLYLSCYKWNFTVIYFRYPSVMSKGNKDADNYDSWETTTVFVISSFQYIAVAFCFSQGPPFRKAIYTNGEYCLYLGSDSELDLKSSLSELMYACSLLTFCFYWKIIILYSRGSRGCDRMVVAFTTTCAISLYHH